MEHSFNTRRIITMTKIQILGTGCPKCKTLAENAEKAAVELGRDYEIIKVTDINEILKFGVMMTPGLAVNNEVKSVGKVLSAEEIKNIIS
jgi:small redox-active disulfide protein 2